MQALQGKADSLRALAASFAPHAAAADEETLAKVLSPANPSASATCAVTGHVNNAGTRPLQDLAPAAASPTYAHAPALLPVPPLVPKSIPLRSPDSQRGICATADLRLAARHAFHHIAACTGAAEFRAG